MTLTEDFSLAMCCSSDACYQLFAYLLLLSACTGLEKKKSCLSEVSCNQKAVSGGAC